MSTFTSPFTGTVVQPTDVSYLPLSFLTSTQLYWPAVVNGTQVPLARIMDCSAQADNLNLLLPQANQGSLGTDILIRNTGSHTFAVTDFSGSNSISIAPGISQYFYLADNTTSDGIWNSITFGAGTSSANAAELASYGLTTTLAGKLATTQNISQISSSPTLTDSSRATTFVWTSGTGTITLPTYSNITPGWYIAFRNSGTGTLSITPNSPSLINGLSTISTNPSDSGLIIFDSSTNNFFTVGLNSANNVTFSAATYDVDSISGSTLSLVASAPIIQTYVALSGTRTTSLTVTLPNITQLYVLVNSTTSGTYNIVFNISGSVAAPFNLAAGEVATIVVDAGNIYVITQTTTTLFYATDGSAGSPSFSFSSDNHTGLYLVGTSVLGISANSTNMLRIDNSNTLSPQITTPAQFNAALISGGSF